MAEYKAIEMAELIERGLKFRRPGGSVALSVSEQRNTFVEHDGAIYHAGALGLALIGRYGDPQAALERWAAVSNTSPARKLETVAELLGISVALTRLVEFNHRNGIPASTIARGLRTGSLGMAVSTQRVTAKPARPPVRPAEAEPTLSLGVAPPTRIAGVGAAVFGGE